MLFVLMVFLWLFAMPVSAKETDELYREQYRNSGMEDLEEALPDSAREYFRQNEIDPSGADWINAFSSENVFTHIFLFLSQGMGKPIKTGAGILAIVLIAAALNGFEQKNAAGISSSYACALATAFLVSVPVFSLITSAIDALKGISVFLLSFLPVFAAVTSVSGAPATAVSMSALLLTAAEGVSMLSSFVIAPFMGSYLAISISGSVSPLIKKSGIAETIKKVSFWIIGLFSAVFTAILGIQTAVNGAADSVGMKTAKFIVGSAVPVAGTALSEALSTVTASMGLLRSSVGIYGVVVCFLTFLPLILEILLWRLTVCLSSAAAELFSLPAVSGILKAIDAVLSVLAGMLLLTGAMFIICFATVISAGRGS